MQSFVHGLPSSSLLLLLAIRCFLVLSLLIAYGQSDSVESNADPLALLRGTFKFWRGIYNTYHDEMSLGYCWADYLLETLSIPRFSQDDFTQHVWKYDSTNPGHFSYKNHSRIDASYHENPSNLEKIARRYPNKEYAFPRTKFQNDSFVPSNFSYERDQPTYFPEFVRDENSRLKRSSRRIHRESTFLAASTRKVSSLEKLPTAHRFLFEKRDRAKRQIELYARNIFEKVASRENVENLGSLDTRKVFDREKITAYRDKLSEGRSPSRISKEWKNISDVEEAASSLSKEKYDRRVKNERRNEEDYSDGGVESQGRRSSSEKLVTRGRSVKRILSTLPEHPIFIAVLRTLTILVRVGRLIMDIVDSSKVLSCTRDYLWSKAIEWIDA